MLLIISRKRENCQIRIYVRTGRKEDEIIQTISDLYASGCKILTIGQYLRPGSAYMDVEEFITPEKFEEYRIIALRLGFSFVESSPPGAIIFSCRKSY